MRGKDTVADVVDGGRGGIVGGAQACYLIETSAYHRDALAGHFLCIEVDRFL